MNRHLAQTYCCVSISEAIWPLLTNGPVLVAKPKSLAEQ